MIDGTLQSDIAGVNLYLLSPSGVIFGPNARLDLMGSLHVSTADVIRLQDGGSSYTQPEQGVLSVATPSAFGILQDNPAGIRIEGGELAIPTGQMMSIVSGDIEMVGNRGFNDGPVTLVAPNGQLHLVSVTSPGEMITAFSATEPSVALDDVDRLGSIMVTDSALLDASSEDGGGTVVVRSGHFQIHNSLIFADTLGSRTQVLKNTMSRDWTKKSGYPLDTGAYKQERL